MANVVDKSDIADETEEKRSPTQNLYMKIYNVLNTWIENRHLVHSYICACFFLAMPMKIRRSI